MRRQSSSWTSSVIRVSIESLAMTVSKLKGKSKKAKVLNRHA
jgi:hypothetical protein